MKPRMGVIHCKAASGRLSAGVTLLLVILCTSVLPSRAATDPDQSTLIRYTVSLAHPDQHLVHVTMRIPAGPAERDLQLPVWNALYQVRDFSQYITWLWAKNSAGQPLAVRALDKSRWHIGGAENGAEIEYEIAANNPGPYDAELSLQHAFFNLAEILMYPVDARSRPVRLHFANVPSGWRIATSLTFSADDFTADNYDKLVDAPVEIGVFRESDFDEGGGHYRVVVDADPADYDLQKIVSMVRSVVAAETSWMNDRPFDTYLFLYHFPRGPGGGGMEHAYSTAIDVNAQVLADDPQSLADVTAHEFFHLWNVKRIRPQSLEPVDYTKENYTTALWFSEGVTSTVEDYISLRAGLFDEARYLTRLSADITELERRPAHLTQSAEAASLDAWLEKYPAYGLPQRSISYYNKGDLLGVVLDLQLREASHGTASLRDLFHWMNQHYPQQGRFFADSEGVREAAEAVSHADLREFFQKYVAGTEEIPWNEFFNSVGLQVVRQTNTIADLGFVATRNFGAPPVISRVDAGGDAQRGGLTVGDSVLEINGRVASSDFRRQFSDLKAGDSIRLKVRNHHSDREITWQVGGRESVDFELKDMDPVTPQQKARRAAWLSGEDQTEARP